MVIIRGPWPEREQPPLDDPLPPNRGRPMGRFAGDPPHLRRFDQRPPRGFTTKLVDNVEVAGISRAEAQQNAVAFVGGEEQGIELERDPANAFDPNSIKVIGVWRQPESGRDTRAQLGWVPAPLAKEITERLPDKPLAATLRVVFLPRPGQSAGLRFTIWQRRGGPRLAWTPRTGG